MEIEREFAFIWVLGGCDADRQKLSSSLPHCDHHGHLIPIPSKKTDIDQRVGVPSKIIWKPWMDLNLIFWELRWGLNKPKNIVPESFTSGFRFNTSAWVQLAWGLPFSSPPSYLVSCSTRFIYLHFIIQTSKKYCSATHYSLPSFSSFSSFPLSLLILLAAANSAFAFEINGWRWKNDCTAIILKRAIVILLVTFKCF